MKRLIIAAMYDVPIDADGTTISVCLGIRIGTPDDVSRFCKLLVAQVRKRYPQLFEGLTPKMIKKEITFTVLDACPDKHGFPRWLGEGWYWQ